jgi:hypothetical protein
MQLGCCSFCGYPCLVRITDNGVQEDIEEDVHPGAQERHGEPTTGAGLFIEQALHGVLRSCALPATSKIVT